MSVSKRDCERLEGLLLDGAALSATDEAFKAEHLAECETCRKELEALERLSLERSPGPAQPLHDLARHRLVGQVLEAAEEALEQDATVLARVQSAAKRWDQGGRPVGLLWSGVELAEVRRWHESQEPELEPLEEAFLAESGRMAGRAVSRRRLVVGGTLGLMALVTLFAVGFSVFTQRASERARHRALEAEKRAELQSMRSARETERARQAEQKLQDQARAARALATASAELQRALGLHQKAQEAWAGGVAAAPRAEVDRSRARLREALDRVRRERRKARAFYQRAEMACRRADTSVKAERVARQVARRARLELRKYQEKERQLQARKRALRSRIITALPGSE